MIQLAQKQSHLSSQDALALANKRIVLTRAAAQNDTLKLKLKQLGASVLEIPLIDVSLSYNKETQQEVFAELGYYEWIVFTSANGVRCFFEIFLKSFKDIRSIGGMRIACVGQSTARAVEKYLLQVDYIPEQANANALAQGLIETGSLDSAKVLVITGNRNRETLVTKLEEEGRAIVDQFQVYKTELTDLSKSTEARDFREQGADYIIFTSPSAVQSFRTQAKHLQLSPQANTPRAVSIGPVTSDAMKAAGLSVFAESKTQHLDGIVGALVEG